MTTKARSTRSSSFQAIFVFFVTSWFLIVGCSPRGANVQQSTTEQASAQEWRIYVADWANHRIVEIRDMEGRGWVTCDELGGDLGKLHLPVGIALDAVGRIYVSEQYHHRIFRLGGMAGEGAAVFRTADADLKPINKFAGSWIALDSRGRIHVTYDGEHRITRMDDLDGSNWVALGTEGSGEPEFRYPAGIAIDDQDRIYVADFDNFRIIRLHDMSGRGWTSFGRYGSGAGEFINPCGICLDGQGRIYVADQGNDRIARIDDMTGANWTTVGTFGTERGRGKLYAPTGVCVDRLGRIYVTQCSSNHRIVRMDDMTGKNWTQLGSGGSGYGNFASPMGIAVR
jgi:DNA-binding beta-propeller fold protein YncE